MSDYQNYQQQPVAPPTSTLATVSLIAGILGLTILPLIGSIVAVITGPMAKREIAQSGGTLGGENLAQIGMILGWVSLGLGVVGCCLAGVFGLFPVILGLLGLAASEMIVFSPFLLLL